VALLGARRPDDLLDDVETLLAMGLRTHPAGEPVSTERFRRRGADGCGRDDRAPQEIANYWGSATFPHSVLAPGDGLG
jgi:hypothetical protein